MIYTNRKNECLKAVSKDGTAIYRFLDLTADIQVMQRVLRNNPELYPIISPHLHSNIQLAELSLKDINNYSHFIPELKNNRKIINSLFKNCISFQDMKYAFEMIEEKLSLYVLEALTKNYSYENIERLLNHYHLTFDDYFKHNINNKMFEEIVEEIINYCPSLISLASNYIDASITLRTVAKHGEMIDDIFEFINMRTILSNISSLIYLYDANKTLCIKVLKKIEENQDVMLGVILAKPNLYHECLDKEIKVPPLHKIYDNYYS